MKHEGSIRSAKIAALLAGTVGILLLVELLMLPDVPLRRVPRDAAIARLSRELVILEHRVSPEGTPEGTEAVLLGSDESARPESVIVVIAVPGYQSMIEGAYRYDRNSDEVEGVLISAVETAGINKALAAAFSRGDIDTLSGATITGEAVTRGETMAQQYATTVFSEDR
ncbi:MAG: FMN-binding protein [Alkalispirochaeta sp.]